MKIIYIAIASAIVYFFSQPFINPIGIVIQRAPEIYKLASGAAAAGAAAATGAFIYQTRKNERSENRMPIIHDIRPTFTDNDSFDGPVTSTGGR